MTLSFVAFLAILSLVGLPKSELPPANESGKRFLKVPINGL